MLEILTNNVHTLKANSLIEMYNDKLPSIQTVILNGLSDAIRTETKSIIAAWKTQRLYVRICVSDNEYPHAYAQICLSSVWESAIGTLLEKAKADRGFKHYDVTIQPFLCESSSGAILCKNNMTILEAVDGNGFTLHRLGQYAIRIIEDESNISIERASQKESHRWSIDLHGKGGYTFTEKSELNINEMKILLDYRLSNNSMYEFCIYEGNVLFLEKKAISENTFFFNLTPNKREFIVYQGDESDIDRQYFEYPKLSHIPLLNKKSDTVLVNGAYLSHLSYYAYANQYSCRFIVS